ncbi:gamma-glutamyltransferase [Oxalicibacterium flavum]|uniref:Gamma-glutamyltransferase n=1 Tax=Oxalicibacterium flavum TaxID=179467 RepID=A0A8J2XUL9_9BURK|nr:gamma-glutamyltransferase family protein [Oxalicibacterium flavum]GGB95890.1 gamma-glutamyltransferase [Oxalicibacterium flavum]
MLNTIYSTRGMAVAPHSLAAQAALSVLREGGNAIEAMLAAASTIAVVYPHMNGIGGDGFWVVSEPGKPVQAIEACGVAAAAASIDFYAQRKLDAIPMRGPLAANTLAGTVGGWQQALDISATWGGSLPLSRLLGDAIHYAEAGIPVTPSQFASTSVKLPELVGQPGFADTFLVDGKPPQAGSRFIQKRMGQTLRALVEQGLDSFYRGELAQEIARDLADVGSLITLQDLNDYRARTVQPVHLQHSLGDLYNMAPPTQGLISLIILGILDRLEIGKYEEDSLEYVHLVVEATKQAFAVRDRYVTDPDHMTIDPQECLTDAFLKPYVEAIRLDKALPWGQGKGPGDTIWMGVIDDEGRAVSFIQSIYHEFGSGVVLPRTGINWQNRGCSFSLDASHINALLPGKKPFHTLNPALARFKDGRTMVYGTMGGDGQPQTQAAVFTRYAVFGQPVQQAVTAPRWLLGRTWGQSSDSLKLESRFSPEIVAGLQALGHEVDVIGAYDEMVGHAGAIVRSADGLFEGGADPRSNGVVAGY